MYSIGHSCSTILNETVRHDQTRLAVIEKANKSGKAVEKAYQDFIRVAGELKTRNAEVHHPQGKWAILPMAFVAFWWMFM
ncbi:hypothetical protein HBI60_254130 [Parastagonospora nodorum]|nr:hypothetical protein HBI60_254130 [Parastagonospora nodorum]